MPRGPRPSRYAGMTPARARITLALLALLMAALVRMPPSGPARGSDPSSHEAIVEAMRHGGAYYAITAREMRARAGDPLGPPALARLPALATIEARLAPFWTIALLFSLAAATMAAWAGRIAAAVPAWPRRAVAALLLAGGMVAPLRFAPQFGHETWAALLIAWSIALRRPGRWIEATALGSVAMLIHEVAALHAVVMAGLAWAEGARREALGWGAGLVVLAAALAAHGWAMAQVAIEPDPALAGWTGLNGGWVPVIAIRDATVLAFLPGRAVAPLIVLALFGWSAWRDPAGLRMVTTLAAFAVLICGAGRLADGSWAMLVAPVSLVGLAFAPDGLRDLVRAALDRRRRAVAEVMR